MSLRKTCPFVLLSLLAAALPVSAVHNCFPEPLRCGETRRASLDATECFDDERSYADMYTFAASAGQEVTIRITSDIFLPKVLLFNPTPSLVLSEDGTGSELTITRTLEASGLWRFDATSVDPKRTGLYTVSLDCSTPALPPGPFLTSNEFPDFRFKVRIAAQTPITGARVTPCLPETLCVSGSLLTRAEVLLRVVGPKPNGLLWPTIVKLTTSQVEVWIEQKSTGQLRYYLLPGADATSSELPGLFDRNGFHP
jgi:hypothetical protein